MEYLLKVKSYDKNMLGSLQKQLYISRVCFLGVHLTEELDESRKQLRFFGVNSGAVYMREQELGVHQDNLYRQVPQ